jgi:hypothetical protein
LTRSRVCDKLFRTEILFGIGMRKALVSAFLAVFFSASGANAIELRSSNDPADHPFGMADLPRQRA